MQCKGKRSESDDDEMEMARRGTRRDGASKRDKQRRPSPSALFSLREVQCPFEM